MAALMSRHRRNATDAYVWNRNSVTSKVGGLLPVIVQILGSQGVIAKETLMTASKIHAKIMARVQMVSTTTHARVQKGTLVVIVRKHAKAIGSCSKVAVIGAVQVLLVGLLLRMIVSLWEEILWR